MHRKTIFPIALIIITLVGSVVTVAPVAALSDDQAIAQLKTFNQAFTAIAQRVTPSVVTVTTKQVVETQGRGR